MKLLRKLLSKVKALSKGKIIGIILVILILCSGSILLVRLISTPASAVLGNQVVTVQRGDLTIDITAVGNLALSVKKGLAFQTAGYVEEILVEEGDAVEEGQVLASLDTTSLELAVKKAELDFEVDASSYRGITYPYSYRTLAFDVPAAVALTGDALREVNEALDVLQELELTPEQYREVWHGLNQAQEDLLEARGNLIRGSGPDVFASGILPMTDFWTLRAAQLKMEKSQLELDEAKSDLEKAVVVAPSAGFITEVNVEGGDEVYRGSVAVQLADPDKFEAEVMVSEMDIFQVKLGGEAWVQVDALPGVNLPAKVTHISPTATIEAGVVNYKVKVEIESLEAVMQERQQVKQEESEDYQLKEGLTVAVSIMVEERNDVLLVPNAAISTQGWETYVQVMTPDVVIEQRSITTGTSDWQYTEVTEGLSEGEQVLVPQGTATTTTTPEPGGIQIPGMGR